LHHHSAISIFPCQRIIALAFIFFVHFQLKEKIMARIVYSALIEKISGKIGGTVFQANAYGFTCKKTPNMVRPNTEYQLRQQAYLSQAVREWNNLTVAQRLDWDTWASTYPQYAKHNLSSQLSGFAVFTKIHVFRFMYGDTLLPNPVYISYPVDTITIGINLTAGVLKLVVSSVTGDEHWHLIISASRPFSDGQNFVGTKPRFLVGRTNVTDTPIVTTEWLALYGQLPSVGQRVALTIKPYGEDNGQSLSKISTIATVETTV
jgi:hypothetical protein